MKGKKGFIRILEAIFAILIIMGAVLILISNNVQTSDISERAYEKQRFILDIVSNNDAMRNEVINYNAGSTPPGPLTQTREFIKKTIPSSWKFSVCVVSVDQVCTPIGTPIDKELYVSETIISTSLSSAYSGAKKLRLFIWR
jgi:hypothetical protein